MGEVIDFQKGKNELIAKAAFQPWFRKFNKRFSSETSISELNNTILKFFVTGSSDSMEMLQDFILQILNFKNSHCSLDDLPRKDRFLVVDISIFLLDQFRFEAMYRLGWTEPPETRNIPLIELALNFEEYLPLQNIVPSLMPNHPKYSEYINTPYNDKRSFIRKLVPELINCFPERV